RGSSPSPSASPVLPLSAIPRLDRSISTASSASSVSAHSSTSRTSDVAASLRRRGYMRPQATNFAESAKNRESVMSLGSIAHLQYYFARTGLLDGKGAQLAKSRKGLPGSGSSDKYSPSGHPEWHDGSMGSGVIHDEPQGFDEGSSELDTQQEPMMLPPTVSTYNYRQVYVESPPGLPMLRRELTDALDESSKVLEDIISETSTKHQSVGDLLDTPSGSTTAGQRASSADAPGWQEIQGLHVLDVMTLAIRAGKNYYTLHEHPQKLYAIKSEREIRGELYQVLDVLKRMAARNFAGGIRILEVAAMQTWIGTVADMLDQELAQERRDQEERDGWKWRHGDWTGRERDREWHFIRSFDPATEELPVWTDPATADALPTPFLRAVQDGVRLVRLHNALVQKSKRHFEEIKTYHTDTNKPYRCADNLKYWRKAAELRWEAKLEFNALDVVQNSNPAAWRQFDDALMKWCRAVRAEITMEW
ncbi:hypothetical protein P152DRAFT_382854, partial [Eremomyces bilateralis CBS 781.70]